MYLIFDTETTGLPKNYKAPVSDSDNWPRAVQLSWQLHDHTGTLVAHNDFIIKPNGFDIPFQSERVHGISTALAQTEGIELRTALEHFESSLQKAQFVVGQNIEFDINIVGAEYYRLDLPTALFSKKVLDTCSEDTAKLCRLPGGRGGKFKLPTLTELHQKLFGESFGEAHNASADVEATARCFFELIRTGEFNASTLGLSESQLAEFQQLHPKPIASAGLTHRNLKAASEKLIKKQVPLAGATSGGEKLADLEFVHLHNHSQFSILQATMRPADLVTAAVKEKMPGVAITDTGNMMGAFSFVSAVASHNKANPDSPIKGIVGLEIAIVEDRLDKAVKDLGYTTVLLAKNKVGYHNLTKLSSKAYTDGFYYIPRIDKNLLLEYKEGLIVLSGGTTGEVSSKALNIGERQAEEALLWYLEQFGSDFYLELQRHGQQEEDHVNAQIVALAQKHGAQLVATNNSFYPSKEDHELQDILLCVKEGELKNTPIGRGRGFRYGLPNEQYYFKSSEAMKSLFADLPEAIENTSKILDKVENYVLYRDVLLPNFDIPSKFIDPEDAIDCGKRGENAYLKHLTFEGATKRYGTLSESINERLSFELQTIEQSGYPGYFLIVEDFIRKAREMGVSVGPGRGSAA
ncbi:MAG: PHP domain-containing protein, partial [Bacteroidetes bacterium]|nr:PHP domain-containing protein [Bacteroidota bacterium]